MPNQIFVSHSRYDKEMVASFDRVFARTGIRSVCMEFERRNSPEWKEIKDAVCQSLATFVLLGQNINRSIYTQNWVAFEVGLACATNKRVWVFQQDGSTVNFPIPYATDFMLYDSLENKEVFDYIRAIIEGLAEGDRNYFRPVDKKIKPIPSGTVTQCPKCKGIFNFHCINNENSFFKLTVKIPSTCPLCLQAIN
jgi:hypothetical protein